MMKSLSDVFLDAGLIQFGVFGSDPVRIDLHLLPSYPDILHQLSQRAKSGIERHKSERLLCTLESLPLGVVCSQATEIPLVYSQGMSQIPPRDLIGAYDVGHPTILLMNTNQDRSKIQFLIENAGRVGLHVTVMISVLEIWQPLQAQIPQYSLLKLPVLVDQLEQSGRLPVGQASVIRRWISSNTKVN